MSGKVDYLYLRCEKYARHKQRQGFSTLDRYLPAMKEEFCECDKDPYCLQINDGDNIIDNNLVDMEILFNKRI
jgi:hypothetical protein